MNTDQRELESLLGQYDPGLIFVGPVLSLPISGYSYFDIAANGRKIYEAVGLGFVENEADLEGQRANFVATLKTRFKEVRTFASHYEMANAVNARWTNEETRQVLASASAATKSEQHPPARNGCIDDSSHACMVTGKNDRQLSNCASRWQVTTDASPHGSIGRSGTICLSSYARETNGDHLASVISRAFQRADQPPIVASSNPANSTSDRDVTKPQGRGLDRDGVYVTSGPNPMEHFGCELLIHPLSVPPPLLIMEVGRSGVGWIHGLLHLVKRLARKSRVKMFGKTKSSARVQSEDLPPAPQLQDLTPGGVAEPDSSEVSSIGPGMAVVGKISTQGTLNVFGRVEGELCGSVVQIFEGAEVEGTIAAQDLVIGGHFKGSIQANRVTLTSTAVVEGEIHHRSLAIEENAWFAGVSRPQEVAANEMTEKRSPPLELPNGTRHFNGSPKEVSAENAAIA